MFNFPKVLILIIGLSSFCYASYQHSNAKFAVKSSKEFVLYIPFLDDNSETVSFRANINQPLIHPEYSQLGQNAVIDNNYIFVDDEELQLKKNDFINYLIVIKDQTTGYHFNTGTYVFNGEFSSIIKPRHRREAEPKITSEETSNESSDSDPLQSRFGYHNNFRGHRNHHHRPHFHHNPNFHNGPNNFFPDFGFNPHPFPGPFSGPNDFHGPGRRKPCNDGKRNNFHFGPWGGKKPGGDWPQKPNAENEVTTSTISSKVIPVSEDVQEAISQIFTNLPASSTTPTVTQEPIPNIDIRFPKTE